MMHAPELMTALVTELANVVGALTDGSATVSAGEAPQPASGWVVKVVVSGSASGTVSIALPIDQAERLTQAITASDDHPPAAAVADTLLELCGQACGALGQTAQASGLTFAVQPPASGGYVPSESIVGLVVTAGSLSLTVGAWGTLDSGEAAAPVHHKPAGPDNLEIILDIDLPITVRFGETDMTLLALSRLGPGSLIDLTRLPDEPVEVLANGRLIAKGEVVSVAGNYGVRVLEVVSAGDRLRSIPVQG